jgi:hypothetical protein
LLQLSKETQPWIIAVYLIDLNDLKTGVILFRMTQEAGVLQSLKFQT